MKLMHVFQLVFLFIFSMFFSPAPSFAQSPAPQQQAAPKEEVYKAEVIKIVAEGDKYIEKGKMQPYQHVVVKILDGKDKGKNVLVNHGETTTIRKEQKVAVGEKIVLLKLSMEDKAVYYIVDRYRLDKIFPLVGFFFVLVIALSRLKGLGSIVGLFISIGVIMQFIIPQILAGKDPIVISIAGAMMIMFTTVYLAHGFSLKTHVAIVSMFLSLLLTGLLAYYFIDFTQLSGLGSEEAYALQFGQGVAINFRGLLFGAILIGALGVLDDITTSLSAVIEEIKKADPKITFFELVKSGLRVGSEHIASLVNTLVLAYAGAGLPLFIFIILNPLNHPLWAIINNELIVEEIIRTLAGSIGLVLAVPITTVLAAWVHTYWVKGQGENRKVSGVARVSGVSKANGREMRKSS